MSEPAAHPVPRQLDVLSLIEHSDRIQREVIKTFVSVNEVQLGTRTEDNCPICLNTLAAAIAEEEMVIANDTPVSPDLLGVVKLETCSHHFCRKCISRWAREGNMRCPACRTPFLGAAQQAELDALEEMISFGSTPVRTEEGAEARSERVAQLIEDIMLQQDQWPRAAVGRYGMRETSNMYS